jgi:hypothetical protein
MAGRFLDIRLAPSLPLPRFTGEGTLAINIAEGHCLLPLPRSGGGLGRGK